MPKVDRTRFPRLIIQVPEAEFPDKLKIILTGRPLLAGGQGNTAQLAADARSLSGRPAQPSYFSTTFEEGEFRKTLNGLKIAELRMPYDEVVNAVGYGHRDDPEDDTPINVSLFTTTQSGLPSMKGNSYNLEGVWAYRLTLTKQPLNSAYVTQYIQEGTAVGQTASNVAAFAQILAQIMAAIVSPALPTPKQIATKVMGAAAAQVQNAIASNADKIAKVKKTADQVRTVANAIQNIIADPSSIATYMPVIIDLLIRWRKDDVAKVVYDFRG
jgi:hypothetical protein